MNDKFESIYRAHVEAVFRYALRLTGDRNLAEDITSEAFLELHRHWNSIEVSRLPGWLLTVAKNRAMDHWRKAAAERPHVEDVNRLAALPRHETDLESWLRDESALKPVHRVCLILHYAHGMTRAEIANQLAVSEPKVKGHLQYALQLLRKAWNPASARENHGSD